MSFMTKFRPAYVIAVAACLLAVNFRTETMAAQPSTVTIETADGSAITMNVEVARTPEEQSLGLMHRAELADLAGMIFVYRRPVSTAFWMKNTIIPLDMIWIDENWTIIGITENVRPLSLTPRPSPGPVIAVLEIAGGASAELGISVNDTITFTPEN